MESAWVIIHNFGDVNILDNDCALLTQERSDAKQVPTYYLDYWQPNTGRLWTVEVERMVLHNFQLINKRTFDMLSKRLRHPLEIGVYVEWFDDKLDLVESYSGISITKLREMFCSEDIVQVAKAYKAVADTYGWDEFDQMPLEMTKQEIANLCGLDYGDENVG